MRGTAATALRGLRDHLGTASLVAAIAAAGLSAVLPVARMGDLSGAGWRSRLLLGTPAAVPEPGWSVARTSADLQAEALRLLFQALGGAALAAFAVGALGAFLVFAAGARERAAEITLRRAVGAPRRTLVAAALTEALVVAAVALAAGGVIGGWLGQQALSAWPGSLGDGGPSAVAATALATLVVLMAGASLALALAPRRRLADASPPPAGLAVPSAQLGLALVLLTAAGLLIRQAASSASDTRRPQGEVYAGSTALAEPAVRATRYAALLASLKTKARYDSVTLAGAGTVVGLGTLSIATTDCGVCPWGGLPIPWHAVPTTHRFVSADSFQALGVRMVAGRGITAADTWDAPRVAVVSRSLAARHFQAGQAIGRRMLLGDDDRTWHTVVGVVDDPPSPAMGSALLPAFTVYASVLQHPPMNVELLVRGRPGAARGADPNASLAAALGDGAGRIRPIAERELVARERTLVAWFARLLALEGWAILLIAAVATAVQMNLWVRSRAPELGLRRAIGATRRRVLTLVLLRAAAVGVMGTVVGGVFGPAVWGPLGTIVRGLPAWDTGVVLRYAALFVGVAIAGALVPAWRAARAQPARLLASG